MTAVAREHKQNTQAQRCNSTYHTYSHVLSLCTCVSILSGVPVPSVSSVTASDCIHIYKEVGQSDPYLPLKLEFQLPDGAKLGKADYPAAKPFGDKGTTMYEDNLTVTQIVEGVSASSKLTCKVSCQCCDAHVCMPPLEKEFVLTVK